MGLGIIGNKPDREVTLFSLQKVEDILTLLIMLIIMSPVISPIINFIVVKRGKSLETLS
jgi:hypothetical protein